MTRRPLLALLAFPFLAGLISAPVHPRLLASNPAADARVTEPPRAISLTFNEAPDLALTRITLVLGERALRVDSLRHASDDRRTVTVVPAAPLAAGRYTVRWQVTGADGHPVRGQFAFDVAAATDAAHADDFTASPDAARR